MNRKDKGDKAERARQAYWEAMGAVVFPVSPNYPGVDLIVFRMDGSVMLSEVKGQRAKLGPKARAEARERLYAARGPFAFGAYVNIELVHVHPDTGEQEVLTSRR